MLAPGSKWLQRITSFAMFALRASCSATRAALSRRARSITRSLATNVHPPPNAFSYLETDNAPAEPTPFENIEDGPPTAGEGNYPKGRSYDSPLMPMVNKPRYRLHCHSSRNNTIATLTKPDGSTIAWASGGSCGFKKSNRAGYEAGYKCAKAMFDAIKNEQEVNKVNMELEIFFKGFGEGREAMKTAMLGAEGSTIRTLVTRVTDRTPLKIGGTRAKKTRRL